MPGVTLLSDQDRAGRRRALGQLSAWRRRCHRGARHHPACTAILLSSLCAGQVADMLSRVPAATGAAPGGNGVATPAAAASANVLYISGEESVEQAGPPLCCRCHVLAAADACTAWLPAAALRCAAVRLSVGSTRLPQPAASRTFCCCGALGCQSSQTPCARQPRRLHASLAKQGLAGVSPPVCRPAPSARSRLVSRMQHGQVAGLSMPIVQAGALHRLRQVS